MSDPEANSSEALANLTKRLDELGLKLSSESARLEEQIAIRSTIATVVDKLSFFEKIRDTDNKNFEKQLQLYAGLVKKAEALRQETKRDIFRIITVGTAIAAACGLIGIPSIKGYLQDAVKKQSDHVLRVVNPLIDFQYKYSRGSGLLAAKNANAALPFLMDCFTDHEYDEAVVIPLLQALDESAEWGQGKEVVDRLLQNKKKLYAFRDPSTWNTLGVVETDVGVMHPEYLSFAKESLDRARGCVTKEDKATQRFIFENIWILSILNGDLNQARQAIDELLKINDNSIDPWKVVGEFKVFQVRFEHDPKALKNAGQMWLRLEHARPEIRHQPS
jgi:hypothetical protein